MSALKLLAEDAEGLAIVAAAAQDGLVKPQDIKFDSPLAHVRAGDQSLPVGARGQAHAVLPFARGAGVRRRAESVRSRGVSKDIDAVHSLMDVTFEPAAEPPGGVVTLIFSGDDADRAERRMP